ncbi:MAG: cytochrome P450 [Chloroflexota bacterium]
MTQTQIPGPKGTLVVGVARELAAEPPLFLNALSDTYGAIVRFSIFGKPFYLVSDPEMIREILVTKVDQFPKEERDIRLLSRLIGEGLVTTNGEIHKRQRRLTQPAFHTKRIEAYADTIVDYTVATMDEWQDGMTLDVSEAMRELTMYIVAKTLFGADRVTMKETADNVGTAIHTIQNIADAEFSLPIVLPTWLPTQRNRDRKEANQVLEATIDQLVSQRRNEATNGVVTDTGDLLSMLLLTQDESGDGMTDREVKDQLLTLFLAGHETTSNALMWTFYLLSQHPDIAQKLRDEVDAVLEGRPPQLSDLPNLPYALQVIKESMRMYPPVWILNVRSAASDVVVGDYSLDKGSMIMISPYVMHHRPEYFPEPERFDPERFTPEREKLLLRYAYMPFGSGPRVCIGNSFAMMEAQLIVAAVAQRFDLQLIPDQIIELNPQITLSNMDGMHMKTVARETADFLEPALAAA